jgi:hypothetical protein
MLTYLDRAFCTAKCLTLDCPRNVTPEVEAAAEKWWGGPDFPMRLMPLNEQCDGYQPAPEGICNA